MLLSACGPTHYLNTSHPEWGQAEFDRDWYQCRRENTTGATIYGAIVDDAGLQACMAARGWRPASGVRPGASGFEEGRAAYLRGDYQEAAQRLRPLAEQGNTVAQITLGVMYAKGQGVAQDYAEALKWHRRAADQGDGWAQMFLGEMYENGQGVPQDYVRAYMWYDLGAAHPSALPGKTRDIAAENRDRVARRMTPTQIAEAWRLAREWKPSSR